MRHDRIPARVVLLRLVWGLPASAALTLFGAAVATADPHDGGGHAGGAGASDHQAHGGKPAHLGTDAVPPSGPAAKPASPKPGSSEGGFGSPPAANGSGVAVPATAAIEIPAAIAASKSSAPQHVTPSRGEDRANSRTIVEQSTAVGSARTPADSVEFGTPAATSTETVAASASSAQPDPVPATVAAPNPSTPPVASIVPAQQLPTPSPILRTGLAVMTQLMTAGVSMPSPTLAAPAAQVSTSDTTSPINIRGYVFPADAQPGEGWVDPDSPPLQDGYGPGFTPTATGLRYTNTTDHTEVVSYQDPASGETTSVAVQPGESVDVPPLGPATPSIYVFRTRDPNGPEADDPPTVDEELVGTGPNHDVPMHRENFQLVDQPAGSGSGSGTGASGTPNPIIGPVGAPFTPAPPPDLSGAADQAGQFVAIADLAATLSGHTSTAAVLGTIGNFLDDAQLGIAVSRGDTGGEIRYGSAVVGDALKADGGQIGYLLGVAVTTTGYAISQLTGTDFSPGSVSAVGDYAFHNPAQVAQSITDAVTKVRDDLWSVFLP
ncbi:hypothetical protein [Nocardia pseudobrasiliensis]|uniref:Uncharacterized protein n=1 Tax=Nocardia pseudobrasiliensis TaxID=45979 RepID=A0A370IC80_9NOCA|nr:hypothetical protein [Nocardia pseudobrasiliensis]RDI68335.1 hypothetical protein DFR76_102736 [Nocardia pseudobrasiliensis]